MSFLSEIKYVIAHMHFQDLLEYLPAIFLEDS